MGSVMAVSLRLRTNMVPLMAGMNDRIPYSDIYLFCFTHEIPRYDIHHTKLIDIVYA